MHQTTQLAHGQISNHDEIVVIMLESMDGTPPLVQVHWPPSATTTTAATYPATAATIVRLIAESATALGTVEGRPVIDPAVPHTTRAPGIISGARAIPARLTQMRRFTLDTSCIIAAVGGQRGGAQIEELVELARSGKIGIVITSGFDVDQRKATDKRRRANLEWLARAQILSVPGPFRLGMSYLGGPDVLTDDDIPAVDGAIAEVVLPKGMKLKDAPAKRVQDVHHLTAHHMVKCDAFVTLDHDDMIRNRADLKSNVGIVILTPPEAVDMARNS
jgi:hypothetical protein